MYHVVIVPKDSPSSLALSYDVQDKAHEAFLAVDGIMKDDPEYVDARGFVTLDDDHGMRVTIHAYNILYCVVRNSDVVKVK